MPLPDLLTGRAPLDEGGPALRRGLTEAADAWLAQRWTGGAETALVAVGGTARAELCPGSDLDLLVLHRPKAAVDPAPLWYAVWDAGIGLDHATRTVAEAVAVADEDVKAALGLLDIRLVAGEAALADELREAVRARWRASAARRMAEVRRLSDERAARWGELAFVLEPDLKEARGGLRDRLVPWAAAHGQLVDPPDERTRAAGELLLDVRCALHEVALAAGRRHDDRLGLADQDAVAARLGLADADVLATELAVAARRVATAAATTFRTVAATAAAPSRRLRLPGRGGPVRRPLADGVVQQGSEVVLARDADDGDPALALRVARVAAAAGLPVSDFTWRRLREGSPGPGVPWPAPVLAAFVAVLGAGPAVVTAVEALDDEGLWERYVPEWAQVRSRPQRNAYHRFTVDRHLLEVVVEAGALTRTVSRPDLLLLAALLHDVGKGYPGDHTDVGVALLPGIAARMGLPDADADVLVTLVRHHLTLAETAQRRDLDDPATAAFVAEAVGSQEVLSLLRALTQADSIGTGPSMWSRWKEGLLDDLTRRTGALLGGEAAGPADPTLAPEVAAMVAGLAPGPGLAATDDGLVVVAAPDTDGLLRAVAGVLALHRLDIRSVDARVVSGAAVVVAQTQPRFGTWPVWSAVRDDVLRALAGTLDPLPGVRERAAAYPEPTALALAAPPAVVWVEEASLSASVLELRAPDGAGLLARALAGLAGCGVELRAARCSTLGVEVVDAFYVTERDGSLLTGGPRRAAVAEGLLAALA